MPKKTCEKCSLSKANYCNETMGWGNRDAKLVILLDAPGSQLAEKLLIWILMRLSLTEEDVWIDYIFKCPLPADKPKKAALYPCYTICWNHIPRTEAMNAKSVVVAGNWGTQFVVEGKMKELHGRKDKETEIWVCYDFKYLLMNPAECVENWCVIHEAAKEAGLNPQMNLNVPEFNFPSKKLAA